MKQFYWHAGPVSILAVGSVWCVEVGRIKVYGIGWRHVRITKHELREFPLANAMP